MPICLAVSLINRLILSRGSRCCRQDAPRGRARVGGLAAPWVRKSYAPNALAWSRSTNFWILPVDVFGSGPNTTVFGTL